MKTLKLFSVLMILLTLGLGCKEEIIECGTEMDECAIACNQSFDIGPCEALIPQYYFDKAEGKCKTFNWGGCEGVVPFETLEACEACDCTH